MAEETHVLFGGKLPGKGALNRAMKELGFPLAITSATRSLEGHSGYLPMIVRREESGVEFDTFDGRAAVEEFAGKDADPRFHRSASFRWGGDENEMLAGLCAAAALARLVEGLVLDEAQNQLLTVDQAIERARESLKMVLPPQKKPRDNLPSNRPADIKRYLKPLLHERDDLVLVGRFLFIRPVRHLIRGAFFDHTGERVQLALQRSVKPLYHAPDGISFGSYVGTGWVVWQPHFRPLLMTRLARDVFARVGRITTFGDFAEYLSADEDRRHARAYQLERVTALQLAGEEDRAAACLEQLQRAAETDGRRDQAIDEHWKLVADVGALCERLRRREVETIKTMKLDHLWESSPFPVELPAAERAKAAEPSFSVLPWLPDTGSTLMRSAPDHAGETIFAKSFYWEAGKIVLLAPLTLAEAEERHREAEDYVLAARLPDGFLMTIAHSTSWDRNDPRPLELIRPLRPKLHVHVHTPAHTLYTDTYAAPHGDPELLAVWSFTVHNRLNVNSEWYAFLNFQNGELGVHDSRNPGPTVSTRTAIWPALRDVALYPRPKFGEYADMYARIRSVLRIAGHGELT